MLPGKERLSWGRRVLFGEKGVRVASGIKTKIPWEELPEGEWGLERGSHGGS